MPDDFVIDKVSWHTEVEGNPESAEMIHKRFSSLKDFLVSNFLLNDVDAMKNANISDDFCIRKSDLTLEGFEVMRLAYDKWLAKVDHGMDSNDVSLLEAALHKQQTK